MKILVINGDFIQVNTSANLCHLAYIRGLVNAGHEVTLLSADGKGYAKDPSMQIPPEVKQYSYDGLGLYELASRWRKRLNKKTETKDSAGVPGGTSPVPEKSNQKKGAGIRLADAVKTGIRKLFGVHGSYLKFVKTAQKFRSEIFYDCILSISTPVTSHLLAYNLLRKKHIRGRKWIQIWEDPWYSDVYGFNSRKEIYDEEKRLLSFAERVCYVSPLTLSNQQRLFPESAHKMYWQPLPSYYGETRHDPAMTVPGTNVYGYFGDYAPAARNLRPFYEAACERGISVNICGNPSDLFQETETVHIHPRMPLHELKKIEDKTNVLIFLCNRKGGQIPGKIYQYSATNKVILFILDGTEEEQRILREYFEKFNRYIFCQNTCSSISEAICRIEAGDFGSVRNAPVEFFTPDRIIEKILKG